MRSKTIAGVKFKLRRFQDSVRLEITNGTEPMIVVPASGRTLQLHHLQTLEDWIKQAQEEIEYGQ